MEVQVLSRAPNKKPRFCLGFLFDIVLMKIMTKMTSKHRSKQSHKGINPFRHLEKKIEDVDRENDRLQAKVLLLSVLSVVLAVAGIMLALFYNH